MTSVTALAALALCWLLLAPAVAGAQRLAKPLLDSLHPQPRAALLLALVLLPPAVALLVALLGFAPLIGGWVVGEHCHAATGCTAHVPAVHADALYAASLIAIAAAVSGTLLWSVARRLRRSLLVARSLRFFAEPHGRQAYEVIESSEPFAYCIGLLRPQVVLSRGLIERLSAPALDVVLRHEQAHAARRDNLRLWLAGLALLPLPRRIRQPLLAELALAGEQACDRTAAATSGTGLVVETLAALGGATRTNGTRARVTFEDPTTVQRRIAALSGASGTNPSILAVATLVAVVYAAAAVGATDLVHHGTELLLALS